jgi:O-antigen ligase
MAVFADFEIGVGPTLAARFQERIGAWGLFALLSAFTLTTLDGGDIAPGIVSAILLLGAAVYFSMPPGLAKFKFRVPAACLLGMTAWGILQTEFFPQKIFVNGWAGVLFWFTAAVIALAGASVFQHAEAAEQFRRALIYFASFISLLDLLQQTSHTNSYYWLIPSRNSVVFGTFAYWNNFAEFIELTLPITLWQGLARSRPSPLYLVLSALQICAVVASGSRAGSVLVLAELLAVVILAYLRSRNRNFLVGAAGAVALAMLFVYAAGFSTVIGKLQESDQLAVRRNINQSSLAMIRARPITGWGLDTYVPVYRMFALYDDGTYVNRAHNDWLQFAAEGGLPFAALLAAIFVWSVLPAVRSGWGIGVIAVGLHAFVDYPFARFGVCGWYFALVSILSCQQSCMPVERDALDRESIY